jgi:hypothetical protein
MCQERAKKGQKDLGPVEPCSVSQRGARFQRSRLLRLRHRSISGFFSRPEGTRNRLEIFYVRGKLGMDRLHQVGKRITYYQLLLWRKVPGLFWFRPKY